jgi:hypothetical protein
MKAIVYLLGFGHICLDAFLILNTRSLIDLLRRVAEQPILLKFPLFRFDNVIQVSGKIACNDRDGFAVAVDTAIRGLICKDGQLPEIVHEGDRLT